MPARAADLRAAVVRRSTAALAAACLAGLTLAAQRAPAAASPAPDPPTATALAYSATIDGVIHPIAAEYMVDAIDRADAEGASLLIFELRTPGGLLDSTRTIISRMVAAKTPVAVFVGPAGARAASAGFLIILAADVAAMAPGTHVGAAHPVSAGGEKPDETTAKKAASDVAAYARTLAERRRRNVALANEAVLESRSFTGEEALAADPPLIDLIVADERELIARLDGRTIRRFDGSETTIRLANARVEHVEMTRRQRFLGMIAHPQIAYLLFSLGILGLTVELWNPGAIFPGVVGGLCILLAFFAFQVLPVNAAGLLLIMFGLALLALEIKVQSFGVLGVGGAASLVFGSMLLMGGSPPELRIGLGVILPVSLTLAGVFLFLGRLAYRAQKRPPAVGAEAMIDAAATALTPIPSGGEGAVDVHGEIWRARATGPVDQGRPVRIVAVRGLTVTVAPIAEREENVP
jgi:membrane-bound serine protease (ClpP class)